MNGETPVASSSRRRRIPFLAGALLGMWLAPVRGADLDAAEAFVRAERERQRVPGVAVAIVKGGEVLKAHGYGLANVEHRVNVKPATIFQSGSVGKQFTAALVMLLVEDGRLSLPDPISARVISEEDIVENRAAGYRLVDGQLKNQEWVAPKLNTTADGSLYLSVLDLVAWDRGLRAGAVLKPESWAQVYEPVPLRSGKAYPYGFGWALEDVAGQTVHRHGGAWQGFKSDIVRYLGDDLTVVVLANLAEADPERFSDGIAAILDPKLAKQELVPIPDREPEVTARALRLLAAASAGTLSPVEFAYVRAGFFPEGAERLRTQLAGLGTAQSITLLERRELGDDRLYTYDVSYGLTTVRLTLAVAPDDRVAQLSLRQR